ncbi:hypothetical protein ACHAQJ_005562 [Trichoderma viride]
MAPSAKSPEFHRFPSFPLELRLQIWRETLPVIDGITLHGYKKGCWGLEQHLELGSSDPPCLSASTSLTLDFRHDLLNDVYIDLPIVFVNREARGAALAWAKQQGIKMHFSEEKNRHVFVLPFDPVRDVLFINTHQWEEFCLEPVDLLSQPDLRGETITSSPEVTQVALPHTAFSDDVPILLDLLHWFPRLQVLFVIVDIDLGLRANDFSTIAARRSAKELMKHDRWTVSEAQGHSFVWNSKDNKFAWRTGMSLGRRSMYRQIEDKATGMAETFGTRFSEDFEIQPVLMYRG